MMCCGASEFVTRKDAVSRPSEALAARISASLSPIARYARIGEPCSLGLRYAFLGDKLASATTTNRAYAMGIAENLERVRRRMREAAERVEREPEEIELVAVTKNVPVSFIKEAVRSGVENIGENRAQEAVRKFQELGTEINGKKFSWHFVGHLQTNKVRQLIGFIDLIHSLSNVSLAREIDKRAGGIGKIQRVLVQVNVAKEQGKFGLDPESVIEFLQEMRKLDNLRVEGLMTIPPLFDNREEARPIFAQLKGLFDQARNELRDMPLKYLSMGMTNDFEIAIEEGSNMVRIGRAIFQKRSELS